MRAWPTAIQLVVLVVVADLTQYWVHRAFRRILVLWRFHAIHHSAEQMDWLAGSRLHLVDVAVTRGLTYVPIYLCGFADAALFTSLVVVSVQATFIHANVRFAFGPLKWLIATPQFHHWHHADEAQAIDKTSILDLRFATRLQSQGSWRRHVDAYSRHTSVGGGNFPCGRVRCSPAGRRDPRADGRGLRPG